MRKALNKAPQFIFYVFLLFCAFLIFKKIFIHYDSYQWDFRVYYSAARAFSNDTDPYDSRNLAIFAPIRLHLHLKFVYPPPTLWFFRFFIFFDYKTSYRIYLFFKVILLLSLLYIWQKKFIQSERDILFYPFLFLAFNSTVYTDIVTGNISIIEQFLLWLGFYFYLERRYFGFCTMIFLVSFFKITPLLFLILLLFTEEAKKWAYLIGTIGCFAIVMLINFFAQPVLFKNFLINALSLDERGIINPSSLALIRDVINIVQNKNNFVFPSKFDLLVFLIFSVVILLFSWKAIINLKKGKVYNSALWLIFFTCLIYSLLVPRFKNYSYILEIIPTFFLIKNLKNTKLSFALYLLPLLTINNPYSLLPGFVLDLFWAYYPLIISFIIWIFYIYEIRKL